MIDPLAHFFTKASIGIGVALGLLSCLIVGIKVIETYLRNIGAL